MLLELFRLDSNRSWYNAIIEDFSYLQESLSNTQVFKSLIGKSLFESSRLTNFNFSATDFVGLDFRSSVMTGTIFTLAEIKEITLSKSSIINTKFKDMIIGPGRIGRGTVFKNCLFEDTTFYSLEFNKTAFEECRFIGCSFSACSFSGCDAYTVQDYVTQNKFTKCTLQDTTFDRCSFNTRIGAYGVKIVKKCKPSPSIEFSDCKGSIRFNETVCRTGLNTDGFIGDVSFADLINVPKATYDDYDYDDDDDDMDVWGSLLDVSGTWPVVEEVKEIKNKFPIIYMSEGL